MKKLAILLLVIFAIAGWIFVRLVAPTGAVGAVASVSTPISLRAAVFAESRADLRALAIPQIKSSSVPPETKVMAAGFKNEPDSRGFSAGRDVDGSIKGFGGPPMPAPSLSFDGLSNLDNVDAFGLLIIPPDMNGDVGPENYVQVANSLARVYAKDGSPLTPPIKLSDIFAPLGTPCAERNDGLPNVLYDPLADRWLISQVCSNFPPFRQMIAVSKTADPAGSYFLYEFVMPNVKVNDFPKFGVWPDGYYMSTDEFLGSDYVGSGMFAFDRARMLAGDASATYIYFNRPAPDLIRRGGMLPADIDGLRPPAPATPALFASYAATEYGDAADAIRLFDFRADFANPSNSTFTERTESPIAVAEFDPTSPVGRQDIAQPPPGEFLDSISDRLNFRLAYRNFGTYESLTVNQTVRVTPVSQVYRAGVRVYELRSAGGGGYAPAVQTTLGDPISSRWIGAAVQDNQGNIAVQYNFVSDEKQPSIYYSGRLASDPAGVFRPEAALVQGTGVQKAFGWRWGEYSGMTVDPVDDCTFWMTNAYYTLESQNISDFTWLTRIGRFKFAECTPAPRASILGTVTNSATGLPIENALVAAVSYTRSTSPSGRYGPMYVPPGTYQVSASAKGYRTVSAAVAVTNGQAAARNFALEPIAVLENTGAEIVGESCRINRAAEPGETVTINVSLRNTGAATARGLRATLLPVGGVTNPGPPQNFGIMPSGGASVTRPFTFTVSPSVSCGGLVNLTLRFSLNGQTLDDTVISLRAGEPRIAFRESFDGVNAPDLPSGWTTASTEGHQLWRTSPTRNQSSPNSLFSPAPVQRGQNEVVSPWFRITTTAAELSFKNWYELETTFLRNRLYDGSVLEIQMGSGGWQDIIAAGGRFISGGYDGVIDRCCENPLAGRMGWSGRSGSGQVSEFIISRVALPAAAAGRDVRLRFRIGSDIGGFREGQYIDDLTVTDGYACGCALAAGRTVFDFDGDGKTDISVYDLNDSPTRADFRFLPRTGDAEVVFWGSGGDIPANADFDGDGKTDFAVFRPAEGNWYVLGSATGAATVTRFGRAGDLPLPFDFDGDGRVDFAVFRPQAAVWYIARSSDGQTSISNFGLATDLPVPADYDADGKTDIAVFRPSEGMWYATLSGNGSLFAVPFGQAGDTPVPGDFDGDGRTDLVVFRPSTGIWYLERSRLGFAAVRFGIAEDKPLQADFDGDGKRDIAVFRPSTRFWYYLKSSDGTFSAASFGTPGERPLPSIFLEP